MIWQYSYHVYRQNSADTQSIVIAGRTHDDAISVGDSITYGDSDGYHGCAPAVTVDRLAYLASHGTAREFFSNWLAYAAGPDDQRIKSAVCGHVQGEMDRLAKTPMDGFVYVEPLQSVRVYVVIFRDLPYRAIVASSLDDAKAKVASWGWKPREVTLAHCCANNV